MRLYSQVGATAHDDPDYGHFEPDDEDGGFPFPDEVSDLIGGFAVKGRKLWETEAERADRLHGQEMARRRDPASMLAAMEQNAELTRQLTELTTALAKAQLAQSPAPAGAPAVPAEPEVKPEPKAPAKRGSATAKDAPAT